jgi:hypothetical protein
MPENTNYLAWKCKNEECSKIFFLPGRVTEEIRPLASRPSFTEEITRKIKESPCCPFCFSPNFEPYPTEIKKMENKTP